MSELILVTPVETFVVARDMSVDNATIFVLAFVKHHDLTDDISFVYVNDKILNFDFVNNKFE